MLPRKTESLIQRYLLHHFRLFESKHVTESCKYVIFH